MLIASRILTVKTKTGEERSVELRVFAPVAHGTDWDCHYELAWPEDGWPAQVTKGYARGSDSLQALQLGMQKLGVELHFASYHRERTMRWQDGWVGYGIALPKEGRDLMIGDDARFYG